MSFECLSMVVEDKFHLVRSGVDLGHLLIPSPLPPPRNSRTREPQLYTRPSTHAVTKMENESTFVAPEGVYSVTEEHKPSILGLHAANASLNLHPTRLTTVTVKFPATKTPNSPQVLSQLLGGAREKEPKKEKSLTKERDDLTGSVSSSDTPDDPPGSPDVAVPPSVDATIGSPNLSHEQSNIFSHTPSAVGKKKSVARPKHNMRTTSSTFITRLQNIDNLNKVLQAKQGETTFLFYNSSKTFIWTEVGTKPKVR